MTVQAAATYEILVRNNLNQVAGEIDRFDSCTYIKRFNLPGSWVIQLSATHAMAPLLQTAGYGIFIERTVNGITDQFSGPVTKTERRGIAQDLLIASGFDDMFWLTGRGAWPVLTLPYPSAVLANSPTRLYAFGDFTSTAVDTSGFVQNGAYMGTYTLQQPPIADDALASVLLGSNGWVQVPTSGLPTGNNAFTLEVWFYYTGLPAITEVLAFIGTVSTSSSAYMGILTTGIPTMQLKGISYSGSTALTVGPHVMQMGYNGTTGYLYVDNTNVANGTPGTCTLAYGTASFGCYGPGTSNFCKSRIHYGAMYNTALNVAAINNHTGVGSTRFSTALNDTQGGAAETVIKHYVNLNGGPGAILERAIPNLTMETDAAQGSYVKWPARFEQLVDPSGNGLIQVLARTSTPELGFRVVQLANQTNLQFQVYVPTDRSSTAIFSAQFGNLADYTYIQDTSKLSNYVVAAGGGVGVGRMYQVGFNQASINNYGRFETFVDKRSITDPLGLIEAIANELLQDALQPTFNGTMIDTAACRYGVDYFLGDKVSVVVDGANAITDLVREVQIDLSAGGGEIVTPAIGTPSNGKIINAFYHFLQPLKQMAQRLAQLERSQ